MQPPPLALEQREQVHVVEVLAGRRALAAKDDDVLRVDGSGGVGPTIGRRRALEGAVLPLVVNDAVLLDTIGHHPIARPAADD